MSARKLTLNEVFARKAAEIKAERESPEGVEREARLVVEAKEFVAGMEAQIEREIAAGLRDEDGVLYVDEDEHDDEDELT
jgi:hypothetical protein